MNHLTYESWEESVAKKIDESINDYMDVIKWAYRTYRDKVLYACSFGAEGIVLIDLISKVNKEARIIFLDTNLHFKETYDLIKRIKERYPTLRIELIEPAITLQEQADTFGEELWANNPNQCCYLRKIEPLAKQLNGVDAWISGLRHEQSPTRKNIKYINKDERFQKIKLCPLIHWTWDDIWSYIKIHNLPYNELHDENYPSIGCEKCTVPTQGHSRAGRWANLNKTECGLHQA